MDNKPLNRIKVMMAERMITNRRSLGFQALTGYGLKEQEVMRKIGIEL